MKKKVLLIDHEGGFGGSSRSLYYLLENIQKKKQFHLEVWCGKKGPIQSFYKNIKIKNNVFDFIITTTTLYSLSRNFYSFILAFYKLKKLQPKLLKIANKINKDFDLVHFNHPNLYLLAFFLSKYLNIPITFHIRIILEDLYEGTKGNIFSNFINRETSRLFAKMQIKCISNISSGLIFISKEEKKSFFKLGGFGKNVISHNIYKKTTLHQNKFNSIKKPKGKTFIAAIENYRWSRGTDRLINLAIEFKKLNRLDLKILLAGDISLSKFQIKKLKLDSKSSSLKDLAKKYRVQSFFYFIGKVTNPEGVLSSSNFLVSFTRRLGPWGRSVIEAMHMGKPVIACGKSEGFVRHKSNGIFKKNFNAKVMASEIIKIIDNKDLYNKMSRLAKNDIKKICNKTDNSIKVTSLWHNIIDK